VSLNDLKWPLYVTNSPMSNYFYSFLTYLPLSLFISRDQRRCPEAERDPQDVWDPRMDCGSFVDATSSEPKLTNTANNISI